MASYRNTIQKEAVLSVLHGGKKHMTAEQVLELVHAQNPVISRSTVFRILNQLAERGEILRVRIPDGADCFDSCNTPHYHIKCTSCGNVFDVDMPVSDLPERLVRDTHGFLFTGHSIIFVGLCPECRKKQGV
ncbi:MAG TPA: transcriptional repressor [Candidatus Ornithomonoglobus intestinigallinarum]|uniref:Transcriptional repressor n=1 Tax=Candidatus Ornithomonoglobus intestinigallinarum TaxID=2840894 RepID=A0A9D1KPT6_9FIRM|nr:transcriptional repressor [Candidatus Ornithomonoglobus intestinigallinarum]